MLSISTIFHGMLYGVVIECETLSSILTNLENSNPNSRFMNWSIPTIMAVFTCASPCTSLFVILIRVFETFQYLVLGDINTCHRHASSDCKTVADANGGTSMCGATVTTPSSFWSVTLKPPLSSNTLSPAFAMIIAIQKSHKIQRTHLFIRQRHPDLEGMKNKLSSGRLCLHNTSANCMALFTRNGYFGIGKLIRTIINCVIHRTTHLSHY